MRVTINSPYEQVLFTKSNITSSVSVRLPNIERESMRNIGIIAIFHYEVLNITSL